MLAQYVKQGAEEDDLDGPHWLKIVASAHVRRRRIVVSGDAVLLGAAQRGQSLLPGRDRDRGLGAVPHLAQRPVRDGGVRDAAQSRHDLAASVARRDVDRSGARDPAADLGGAAALRGVALVPDRGGRAPDALRDGEARHRALAGARRSGERQPREERVPRQYEPRAADAAERDSRVSPRSSRRRRSARRRRPSGSTNMSSTS